VHLLCVSKVLSSGEGETGSDNTLDGRIVGEVHEQHDAVHGTIDLEVSLEEAGSLHIDTHSGEDDDEVLVGVILHILVLDKRRLTANLGTDSIVRKTSSGEEGNLLTTGDGVHHIDSGDTRLDHFLGVVPLERINGLTLDIEEAFSEDGGTLIDRLALTIELATQHFGGDGHLEHVTGELTMSVSVVNVGGTLKDLSHKSGKVRCCLHIKGNARN